MMSEVNTSALGTNIIGQSSRLCSAQFDALDVPLCFTNDDLVAKSKWAQSENQYTLMKFEIMSLSAKPSAG